MSCTAYQFTTTPLASHLVCLAPNLADAVCLPAPCEEQLIANWQRLLRISKLADATQPCPEAAGVNADSGRGYR